MSYKSKFVTPIGPYFQSHSIGLQPLDAMDCLSRGFHDAWAKGDGAAWDNWLETIANFKESLAALLHTSAHQICPQTNVSSALTKILFCLEVPKGRTRIVLTEDDFPTTGFVLQQAERLGLSLTYLPAGPHLADPGYWKTEIDETVFLVHATHVFSNSSLKLPIEAIARHARSVGCYSIIDAAQSLGAIALDADKIDADFITGTSVKYLCGGPGAAWLWANLKTIEKARPIDLGWFSHARPFEFDIHEFDYAGDADRFMGGTPSIAPFAYALAGLDILNAVGPGHVEAHNQSLLDDFIGQIPASWIASHAVPNERGSAVLVRPPDVEQASNALLEAKIYHDIRNGALRLSFHLYNDARDVEALVRALNPSP